MGSRSPMERRIFWGLFCNATYQHLSVVVLLNLLLMYELKTSLIACIQAHNAYTISVPFIDKFTIPSSCGWNWHITHTRPIRSCDVNGADGLHYRTVVYINSKRSNELSVVQLGKYMLCGSIHCCYQSRRLWLSTEPRSCTDHTWNVLLV